MTTSTQNTGHLMATKSSARKRKSSTNKAVIADVEAPVGNGGEIQQAPEQGNGETMTTQQGVPVSDNQNSLKTGQRGPTLLEDFHFREKIFHFDHERIPERVVHARGYGAHGYFETYESLSELTSADIFQRKGEKTPAFVRFSTVAGNKGSVDLARDVRGFAVKLYTKQGNWDIVGNNIPVFFIQDAMKFPDLIHSAKDEPDRGFPQAQTAHDNFWDFISLTPEAMHMVMWIMSDRAIPRSFRFMEGFGVHTFRLVNAKGQSHFVKFHWKPKLGMQSVTWDEAVKINGADPDFHRRDLWDTLVAGEKVEWELGLQVFDDKFADEFEFDVLDATKLIPEEQVPVRIVGRLVLDRVVDNFFAETEQVAFCTQNIVPGIDFTNDPLLQGRNFSYLDTQVKRLGGPNFTHIPINAPKCPFHHFQQDGHMAMTNPQGRVNYEPNSWGDDGGPRASSDGFTSYSTEESGEKGKYRSETFADHYSQARQFYVSQTDVEREHMRNALVFELSKVKEPKIRVRVVAHLLNIDKGLAEGVAAGLGIGELPKPATAERQPIKDLPVSDALSMLKNPPQTFAGRKLGVLVTDGFDGKLLGALRKAAKKEKANVTLVAPVAAGIQDDQGQKYAADEILDGAPSVLFDAVAILVSEKGADDLLIENAARQFIGDAIAHKKFVAYSKPARALVEACRLEGADGDQGLLELSTNKAASDFLERCRNLRAWEPGQ